jgi:hypothetical protein
MEARRRTEQLPAVKCPWADQGTLWYLDPRPMPLPSGNLTFRTSKVLGFSSVADSYHQHSSLLELFAFADQSLAGSSRPMPPCRAPCRRRLLVGDGGIGGTELRRVQPRRRWLHRMHSPTDDAGAVEEVDRVRALA